MSTSVKLTTVDVVHTHIVPTQKEASTARADQAFKETDSTARVCISSLINLFVTYNHKAAFHNQAVFKIVLLSAAQINYLFYFW